MEKIRTHVNKKTGETTYHAAVRVTGFERCYDSFATEAAALEWQKQTHARLIKERRADTDPRSWLPDSGQLSDQRLRDLLERYQPNFHKDDWHYSTINAVLRFCGNPTVGQLFPSWIKDYIRRARKIVTERGTPYSFSSIKRQLSVVSTGLKWRAEELNINPPAFVVRHSFFVQAAKAEGLREEDLENERDRRFEEGEEQRLMQVLKDSTIPSGEQWKLFVEFAIHTGARLQEMAKAQWSEIDPTGEWWHIPGKHSKTKSRTMVLTDEAMDVLDKMRALRDPSSKRIFHGLGKPDSLSNRWAADADKAGMPDFVFHDLRHEGISRLVLNQTEIPIKALMTMVGHSSLKMLDRYAKLRPNELSRLVRRRSAFQVPAPATPENQGPRQPSGPKGDFACRFRRARLARAKAKARGTGAPTRNRKRSGSTCSSASTPAEPAPSTQAA